MSNALLKIVFLISLPLGAQYAPVSALPTRDETGIAPFNDEGLLNTMLWAELRCSI